MSIKRLSKKYIEYTPDRNIWDKQISVKQLLLYSGYALLSILLILVVIGIPFMIGRASVNCDCSTPEESLDSENSLSYTLANTSEQQENASETLMPEASNESNNETLDEDESLDAEVEVIDQPNMEEYDESVIYLRTDPRVTTTYTNVDIELLDYDIELRGEDWGTITEIEVKITNYQTKIIIPFTLKTKIYNSGEYESDWWDDESGIREEINIIAPGDSKTVKVSTHISFSDVDIEKKLHIYLTDEVGKEMSEILETIDIEDKI